MYKSKGNTLGKIAICCTNKCIGASPSYKSGNPYMLSLGIISENDTFFRGTFVGCLGEKIAIFF